MRFSGEFGQRRSTRPLGLMGANRDCLLMNGRLDAGFRSSVAVQTEIPLIGQVEFDALL